MNVDGGSRANLSSGAEATLGVRSSGRAVHCSRGAGLASGESESGVADLLRDGLDCGAVVLASLVGEAEESEENDGTDDGGPTSAFETANRGGISPPEDSGD